METTTSPAVRSASAPKPPAPARGPLGETGEKPCMRCIRRNRERPREAGADERGIDEATAGVDVGEEPPVGVLALAVEVEPHGAVVDETMVEGARLRPEALHRGVRLHRLRRVDADVADVLGAPADPDQRRVAVDGAEDAGAEVVGEGAGSPASPLEPQPLRAVRESATSPAPQIARRGDLIVPESRSPRRV